jgi:hypothetical protein
MSYLRQLALALPLVIAACSSNSGGPTPDSPDHNPACASVAGTWTIGGSCGPDVCNITQNGCTTSLSCSGGAASYAGSIDGSSFTYTGTTADGDPATCTGTTTPGKLSGTCTIDGGVTCNFTGSR